MTLRGFEQRRRNRCDEWPYIIYTQHDGLDSLERRAINLKSIKYISRRWQELLLLYGEVVSLQEAA